jgi:hypothetical protein
MEFWLMLENQCEHMAWYTRQGGKKVWKAEE